MIGDARIVSLGECTHGSSEIFSMKHRMLEYLVKEKGFTLFSIEANMPESYALNDYIIDGKGDPKKLIAGMYFWTWYTQEVLDMVEWMKMYNETATKKVMFTGFDMQTPHVASKVVRNYLTVCLPSLLTMLDNYDSLSKKTQVKKNESKTIFRQLKSIAQLLLDSMHTARPATGKDGFDWALQNARILWQYACNYYNAPSRDESMAENAKWIADQNPGAKMVIWAHNEHIRKDKNKFGSIRMGEYLNRSFGNQMVVIGFSSDEGTYTAVQKENKKFIGLDSTNRLISAKKGSFEEILSTADAPDLLLDLRNIKKEDEGAAWLMEKKLFRHIGALAEDKYQFVDTHLTREYDMIIFIRRTSASKCFSIKKLAER